MNRYQALSRRLLGCRRAPLPGSKPPFWLTQRPLLAPDWLTRAREAAGRPARRAKPR